MLALCDDQARLLRIQSQRIHSLGASPISDAAQAVRETCGIQAQDPASAALAIRARTSGLTVGDVDAARLGRRSIVRTWCQRGTFHLVAAEDLALLLPLVGPAAIRSSRRRLAELGLDEPTCVRGVITIQEVLSGHGPLTRAELTDQMALRDLDLDGQAPYHLIRRAALEGIVCLGPDQGKEPTYVLLEDWTGRPVVPGDEEQGMAELVRRYLDAYGPATPEDMAAWSGLNVSAARKAWKLLGGELTEVEVRRAPAWTLGPPDIPAGGGSPVVRLLPYFDTLLLGYASRDLVVDHQYDERINRGGGWISRTVVVDGRLVAVWRSEKARGRIEITVEPFDTLSEETVSDLRADAADLGRFLGMQASLEVATPS